MELKVGDLGNAKSIDASQTNTLSITGTLMYMSPEKLDRVMQANAKEPEWNDLKKEDTW